MKFPIVLIFIIGEHNAPSKNDIEKGSFCEKISASEKMETELHTCNKVFEPLESSDDDDDDDDDDDTNHYDDMIDHELIKGEYMESGICVLDASQHCLRLNRSTIEGKHDNDSSKNNNDSTSDSDEDDYVEPYAHNQKSKERAAFNYDVSNMQKWKEVTDNENFQSKPDVVIEEKKLPKIPWMTNALKQENNGPIQLKKSPKKTSTPAMIPPPLKRNQDRKPLPKPRPKTVGDLDIFCKHDFDQDHDKPSGNVRSLAHELQNKIKPVPFHTNITRAKLKQTEYSSE